MKNELLQRVKTQLKNNWYVDRGDIQALIDIAEKDVSPQHTPKEVYQSLFNFFHTEHGLVLTEGEMDDIVYAVKEFIDHSHQRYSNTLDSKKMKAPDKIYLQIDETEHRGPNFEGVTWCKDRINDSDVEYIRVDHVFKSLTDETKTMPYEELLNFVDEIEKWCYLDINAEPHISLNGIEKAIEILEQRREQRL